MRPLYRYSATAWLLSVAACTTAPVPTPTPAPMSYQCTTEAGGAPYACTEIQHQEMLKKDALYAEAELVYRAYTNEAVRLYRDGAPASEELLGMVHGEIAEQIRQDHPTNIRLVGGEWRIERVDRLPGVFKGASDVALEACTDASSMRRVQDGRDLGPGRTAKERTYFKREGARLAIVWSEFAVVASC